jgi:hypothetical protein
MMSSLGSGLTGLFTPGAGGVAPITEFTKWLNSFGGGGGGLDPDIDYDYNPGP